MALTGADSKPDFGLPRERRIDHPRRFKEIKEKGERLVMGSIILNWLPNNLGFSRLGVITPARIGKSHDRSRARRLMRESFRLTQPRFQKAIDLIMVARQSITYQTGEQVRANLEAALKRAKLLRTE